ncbi:hypothetical protein JV173_03860 [Acholeplasma equirhinis]|uniref:hypothetical protein n=1 Tax=Acholeplasma equirhinis TaxID=555393 RepID=UPI00197AC119|nr:hypothetical protein [Acholeplasma equirhinis]MBN3490645.1 hypothetical protein [Acholeplasma equirhinis]
MTEGQIYTLIIASIVVLLGAAFIVFYVLKTKQNKEKAQPTIDVSTLLEALGGASNIVQTSLDNKRLKVTLSNPKLVSQTLLKSMGIIGMLSGKELKLLIKDNPVTIKTKLDQLKSEVTK